MKGDELSRRTRRSFLTGGAVGFAGWLGWRWARGSKDAGGTPSAFRRAFEWSGELWQRAVGPRRLSPEKPRQTGPARVNGDLGLRSPIDLAAWRLRVTGTPLALTMDELRALPRTEVSTEFKCVEGWKIDLTYAGVRFSDFVERYGLLRERGDARVVGLVTPDEEYFVSIDLESMLHPQTLLAYEINGAPLTPEHGAPLRLVIPIKYGIKSIKRIGTIAFARERLPDFWAEQGYDWYSTL